MTYGAINNQKSVLWHVFNACVSGNYGRRMLHYICFLCLSISLAAGTKMPVIFDTDANNELDDQHALAYLLFSGGVFDVLGVTVNATKHGGDISQHYAEAKRVMTLRNLYGKIPLLSGANEDFESIRDHVNESNYDGSEAVKFIIEQARMKRDQKLVLLPVGKLTNIALAILKAPDIKEHVRIVWLGSNYPRSGEYNLENDIPSMNYLLDQEVEFEVVTVRYSDSTGSTAVRTTREDMHKQMPGAGVRSVAPVEGRHGGILPTLGTTRSAFLIIVSFTDNLLHVPCLMWLQWQF